MTRLPRLALRLHGGQPAAECVEQARVAEQAGFATIWFAENPFTRGVVASVAACALATRTIRLGIGVVNPFNRHPTLIAMEAGALDEISAGRLVLGIGAGIKVAQMGLSDARRIAAVRDAISIVRPLLRGEELSYAGKVFSAHAVRLEFQLQRRSIPIVMAAMGDQALRLCGEIADGLMISNMSPPAFTRRAVGIVAQAAAATGRARPADVIQYVPCAIRDSGSDARALAKIAVGRMLTAYWQGASAATKSAVSEYNAVEPRDFARMMQRLGAGEPAPAVIDDTLLLHYAIAGTPDECIARCEAYGDAGVTELGLWFVGDRPTHDIGRFGRLF
jgi:5,10-methylenetetrahydromethanopterin reductase